MDLVFRQSNKVTKILVALMLIVMFVLMFFSLRGDSATMDELAHTPAGYSYLVKKDMRLNPEHPPLLKDLAGLSVWLGSKLTATPINFPDQIKPWQEDINGQWDFGRYFLYQSGNDADRIIFWSRLPFLLLALCLGIYIFKWTRQLYGHKAGLLALFFYSLSPTFLAHSRLVTTDVGAAAAFFIATYYLVKWLQKPNRKNLIIAGLVFGLAMLTKFSLALLIPYFVVLVVIWVIVVKIKENEGIAFQRRGIASEHGVPTQSGRASNPKSKNPRWGFLRSLKSNSLALFKPLICLFLIGLIGMALVWPIYQYHTWNYPPAKQQADTQFILQSFGSRKIADTITWMADKPILRPYAQFFLGLLMVMQRAVGGHTVYFLGEVSAAGWKTYFPIVYLFKVPLALHILTLIVLLYLAYTSKLGIVPLTAWLKNHFTEFAMLFFILLYWAITMKSNLNIGVRHILPTFPFLYVLVSGQIIKLAKHKKSCFVYLGLFLLLAWYAFSSISIYPHFLAYFNELIGGPKNGYQYVVDSNLDWGQDLKRLTQWVEKNKINKIYVDYFGGSSPEYYLGDKFLPWHGSKTKEDLMASQYLAVSATFLQGGRGCPAPGHQDETGYYRWLDDYQPIAVIGYSIFVYQIK